MGRHEPRRPRLRVGRLVAVLVVLAALVGAGAVLTGQVSVGHALARLSSDATAPAGPGTASSPATPAGPATSAGPASPSSPATPTTAAIRVVALGDSVTAGSACDCVPFPTLYARHLQQSSGRTVHLDNRGVSGATSGDAVTDLQSSAGGSSVAAADVVLVTIGANDFGDVADDVQDGSCGGDLGCAQDDLAAMRGHLGALLAKVARLREGRPTAVLVTGYWNVFEDGDVADQDYSSKGQRATDALTREVNAADRAVAQGAGATYVDLYTPFKGATGEQDPTGLLADDGDHPDARGHRVIAAALLAAGTAPLDLAR